MAAALNPWARLGAPKLQALAENERFYVLIDAAQVDRFSIRLAALPGVSEHAPVFGDSLATERANATPHLLRLAGPDAYVQMMRGEFAKAIHFYGALSCLVSPLEPKALAARLLRRMDAQLPDRFDCINRFFDGRVTPHLHDCMTPAQRGTFFSVASQWWVVSHTHTWQSLACSYQAADAFEPPLQLDNLQQAHMIDACYPYAVIEHFQQTDEELLDELPPPERYAFFRETLKVAAGFGIDGGATAILFCTLALTRGPRFYAQAPWPEALGRVKRGEISLQQVVKAQHE
jgi:Domain of unknown function (DUF4123)